MKMKMKIENGFCLTWQLTVICYVPVPGFRVGLVFSAFAATIEVQMFLYRVPRLEFH